MIESAAVRYFREVTECGSIKQAAASLRIAPSAISRQVQTIEEELSVKLFERGARGMVLTDAGHLLGVCTAVWRVGDSETWEVTVARVRIGHVLRAMLDPDHRLN